MRRKLTITKQTTLHLSLPVRCTVYKQQVACKTANCSLLSSSAGDAIAQLTDMGSAVQSQSDGRVTVFSDRTGMVKAARLLLSSVTKVLVLADRIVIKQIITSRNKVNEERYPEMNRQANALPSALLPGG